MTFRLVYGKLLSKCADLCLLPELFFHCVFVHCIHFRYDSTSAYFLCCTQQSLKTSIVRWSKTWSKRKQSIWRKLEEYRRWIFISRWLLLPWLTYTHHFYCLFFHPILTRSTGYKWLYFWLEILSSWKSMWILLQISISPGFSPALFFNMFVLEYFSPAVTLSSSFCQIQVWNQSVRFPLLQVLSARFFHLWF